MQSTQCAQVAGSALQARKNFSTIVNERITPNKSGVFLPGSAYLQSIGGGCALTAKPPMTEMQPTPRALL